MWGNNTRTINHSLLVACLLLLSLTLAPASHITSDKLSLLMFVSLCESVPQRNISFRVTSADRSDDSIFILASDYRTPSAQEDNPAYQVTQSELRWLSKKHEQEVDSRVRELNPKWNNVTLCLDHWEPQSRHKIWISSLGFAGQYRSFFNMNIHQ